MFYGRYFRFNIMCYGNESIILDCKYDELRSCQRENYFGYVVVFCYNGIFNKSKTGSLIGYFYGNFL